MSDWDPPPPFGGAPGQPPAPGGPPPQFSGAQAALAGKLQISDLLGTSMRAIAANLGPFALIAFLLPLPGLVISAFCGARLQENMLSFQQDIALGMQPDFSKIMSAFEPVVIGGLCFAMLLNFIMGYLAQAMLMFTSVEFLAGRKATAGQAFSKGMSRMGAVLVIAMLTGLATFLAALPGVGVAVLLAAAGGGAGACCGIVIMFVGMLAPAFYIMTLFFVAIPTAVAEQHGPIESMSRSVELTRGNRVPIVLSYLAFLLAVVVFACIGGCFTGAAGGQGIDAATGMPQAASTFSQVLSFILNWVTTAVQIMGVSALAAVTYARIRGVRDGVDADALARVFS
jgi:hypothetical protein